MGVCVFPLYMAVCSFILCIGVWVCLFHKQAADQYTAPLEGTWKTNSQITSKDSPKKLTYLGYTMHHFDLYTSGDFLYHPVKLK